LIRAIESFGLHAFQASPRVDQARLIYDCSSQKNPDNGSIGAIWRYEQVRERIEKAEELHFVKKGIPDEHTCGAIDEREARMLMHIIMAEIRKSDAPVWVNEELQKKFECNRCWDSQKNFPAAYFQ
jgi:hypothetical protein